jgi:uncharacterized protein involved in outer membrane biogenesis
MHCFLNYRFPQRRNLLHQDRYGITHSGNHGLKTGHTYCKLLASSAFGKLAITFYFYGNPHMALLKWIGIVLGSLLLVLVLLLSLLDSKMVRDYAARQVSQMTGRTFTIEGDFDIDWSLKPRIRATDIRLGNASWSQTPNLLELAALELRIDLLALLTGRVVLPELKLSEPRVLLEVSSEGQPNWVFSSSSNTESTSTEEKPSTGSSQMPTIKRLVIEDGVIAYRDPSNATDITAMATITRAQGSEDALELRAEGKFEGEPIRMTARGGSVLQLRDTDEAYPVTLQLQTASTTIRIDGTLENPLQLKGLDLAVDVQGEGTVALPMLAGSTPLQLPPYRLRAQLSQHDQVWSLSQVHASLGQSDLGGQATLTHRDSRPWLQATLMSHTLDTVQLQEVIETNMAQVSNPKETTSIDARLLQLLDAKVTWQIQQLVLPQGSLDGITLQAELYAGQLRINPLLVPIGDGAVRVQARVDGSSPALQGSLQVELDQVDVDQSLTLIGMDTTKTGTLDGQLSLSLAPTADPTTPLTPSSLLQRLQVDPSTLSYDDAQNGTDIDVTIRQESINDQSMIKIVGQGRYQNQSVDLEAKADSLARLAPNQAQDYTVATDVTVQGLQARLQLSLGDLSAPEADTGADKDGMSMQVSIQGADTAALNGLLGTSLPDLGDFQIKGNIRRRNHAWNMEQMTVSAAGIELQGDMAVTTSGARPFIRVDLVVETLDVQRLLDTVDQAPAAASTPSGNAGNALLSVGLTPLRAVDAEVKIRAHHIETPHFPLDDVTIQATLYHGMLNISPLNLQIHGGQMAADIGLNAWAEPLDGTIRSTLKDLDLGKVLQPFIGTSASFGTLSGNLNLAATGVDPTQANTDVIMPFLGRLAIEASQLSYVDPARPIDVRIQIDTEGLDSRAQKVNIDAEGQYKQEPFTLHFRGDPLLDLRQTEEPYAFEATINAVQTELHAEGRLIDPLTLKRVDMNLAVAGPDPKRLSPLLGLPVPSSPPYQVQGHLIGQDQTWKLQDLDGRVGDSDLRGEVQLKTGGERPYMWADLDSNRIDFDDLGPLIGKAPETGKGETASAQQEREQAKEEASPTVLPKDPLHLDRLRRLDASVQLRGNHIESILPLEDVTAKMTLQAGRLTIDPIEFGVAGGRIRSHLELDADSQPAKTDVDIEIKHVRLKDILARFDVADESVGLIGGQAKMWAQGNSVADLLASLDGGLLLLMSGGQFEDLLVELAGLDLGESFAALFGDKEQKFTINCALVDLHAKQGVAQLKTLVVDTDDTLFLGDGTIDFTREGLDLTIDPKPKDLSLFSARAPIYIQGTLKEPKIRPGESAIIRGAASLAMLPAAPLTALMSLLNPDNGDEKDKARQNLYCSGLADAINQAR